MYFSVTEKYQKGSLGLRADDMLVLYKFCVACAAERMRAVKSGMPVRPASDKLLYRGRFHPPLQKLLKCSDLRQLWLEGKTFKS